MHLAQGNAVTGIPLSQLGDVVSSLCVAFTCHPPSDGLSLLDNSEDTWSWRELFAGTPLLESRRQALRLIQAQPTRDANRARRTDPPVREVTTFPYASKVLNLASLPQGTRGHYEKLLHESHWTIGHYQCEGARTNESSTQLLTSMLFCSDNRTFEDTYYHVFRLCPHSHFVQCHHMLRTWNWHSTP